MPRSPLTEKFLRIVALRDEVKSWPQDEQDFFLDMLAPEPAKKPQKKSSKKAAGGGGKSSSKSAHASSLESAIKGRCVATIASTGKPCGLARPHVIHSDHNQDVDAHDFLSAAQLNKSLQRQRKSTDDDDNDGDEYERCQAERDGGKVCFLLPDHNIHHLESAMGYHPFVSYASRVASQSSANNAETSSTASSATEKDAAGDAHHAASSGD